MLSTNIGFFWSHNVEGVFDESIAMLNHPSTIIFGLVKNSNLHGNRIEWKLGSYLYSQREECVYIYIYIYKLVSISNPPKLTSVRI